MCKEYQENMFSGTSEVGRSSQWRLPGGGTLTTREGKLGKTRVEDPGQRDGIDDESSMCKRLEFQKCEMMGVRQVGSAEKMAFGEELARHQMWTARVSC